MLETLQRVLNRHVRESTAALDLLAQLRGSSFAIELVGTGLQGVLMAETDELRLRAGTAGADATLRATPLDMLRLLRADSVSASALQGTRAQLTGDLQVAERFAALLRLARPDLEEELAKWVGGIAARQIGQAASAATGWLARASRALQMNTAEFLQEESRTLPGALQAQAFYADVERLRDDVERTEARLARLEQQRAAACAASDSL